MNGIALLTEFRESQAENAFAGLVRHYTNLVYSVARRRTGNDVQAGEITQLVFIRLARTAPRLKDDFELVAWLHRTTVNASIDFWRSESRRRAREEQAVSMQLESSATDDAWHTLAPALDQALNELAETDRRTLLLRFFQGQSMRELGAALGISEDAAKMRVSRALERLRDHLARSGVTCGVAALGALLTERAVEAAPAAFADSLAQFRFPAAAGLGWIASMGMVVSTLPPLKLAAGMAAVVLATGTLLWVLDSQTGPAVRPPSTITLTAGASAALATNNESIPTDNTLKNAAVVGEPDPLMLLLRVADARKRLVSGTVEYTLFAERFLTPVRETNFLRFKSVFDGSRRWFESSGREYRYVKVGSDAAKEADPIIAAQGLDREGAVKAGLLASFEAHIVTLADGTNYLKHRETDGRPDGVIVDDPEKGPGKSGDYFLDFRCLGLSTFLYHGSTIDGCLGYIRAKSIKLVGRELVEGVDAWHVRVIPHYDTPLDFWIDIARPERLLKCLAGKDVVVSRYDANSRDPLPSQVHIEEYRDGAQLQFRRRFDRVSATFDLPVDPALWTMAGLGMPVGTVVNDLRIHRSIGYWNGVGLSASPPPARASKSARTVEPVVPVDRAELLASLETMPESDAGFDAAEWILLNTPDGPEVERAAEAIQAHHLSSPRLQRLARDLERFRHRSARPLLEGVLRDNPKIDIRATACAALATMLKDQCDHGKDVKLAAEAEAMLERVIAEFATVPPDGPTFALRARRDLRELRTASVGKPAPDFSTEDIEGHAIRLSEFRGQIVVLVFWSGDFRSERENHHNVEEQVSGKQVKVIGINMDSKREKAKSVVEQIEFQGTTILEGRDGPIATAWNINSWPTVIVVDSDGVIRYRGHYSQELHQILKKLAGI